MFIKPLKYIFTTKALQEAYKDINKKSSGIDNITFEEFEKNITTNISQITDDILLDSYVPEPLKKIEINKPNSGEKRPIGLSAIKDKIIQKVLDEQKLYDKKQDSIRFYHICQNCESKSFELCNKPDIFEGVELFF